MKRAGSSNTRSARKPSVIRPRSLRPMRSAARAASRCAVKSGMRTIPKDPVRTDKVQRMPEDGSHGLLGGVVVDHRNLQTCLPKEIHGRGERITTLFLTNLCKRLADVFFALVCRVHDDYAFGSASLVHVFPAGQTPLDIALNRFALIRIRQADQGIGGTSFLCPGRQQSRQHGVAGPVRILVESDVDVGASAFEKPEQRLYKVRSADHFEMREMQGCP